jgi:hypothetical protein
VIVELDAWETVRSGHLHAVWRPGAEALELVDLSRHPLRPWPKSEAGVSDIEAELSRLLRGVALRFFRIAETNMVSEPCEGRDAFRRRASGAVRPLIQHRIASHSSVKGQEHANRASARLASELARATSTMEQLDVESLAPWVRRADVGELWLAPGVTLAPRRHRDPMV